MNLPKRIEPRAGYALPEQYVEPAPRILPAPPADTLSHTIRKLWRHRSFVVWCTLGAALLSAVVALLIPGNYIGEAQVLVTPPAGSQMFQDLNQPGSMAPSLNSDDRVQSERYVALSRVVAQQAADKLQLTRDPEFNLALRPKGFRVPNPIDLVPMSWRNFLSGSNADMGAEKGMGKADLEKKRTVDMLISKIDVAVLGRSDVLDITARSHDPAKSANIANAVANAYLAVSRADKTDSSSRVDSYMEDRIAKLREQVQVAEKAVEDYRTANALYIGETSGLTSQRATEMNTQLTAAETDKAEADAKLQEAQAVRDRGLSGDSVPEVLASPLIQDLKERQAEAERNLAQVSASYGEKHPKVLEAQAQIRDIHRKIQTEISSVITGLERQDRVANQHLAALNKQYDQTQRNLGGVNEKTIKLEALQRDATVYRSLLESMLTHQKEISWQSDLEQSDARIISPASPPDSPGFPRKSLIVLLGTLVGALGGLMGAVMRDGIDRTFRRYDDLETATGLPVIAMVPNLRGSPAAQVLQKPLSPYSEALRRVQIGIQMLDTEKSPKTVLFCSATPGEGKSMMIASLGRTLAAHGKRVVVIDCDWRNPGLQRIFRLPNRSGLAALLTDDTVVLEDCIQRDHLSGLDVITAGRWESKDVTALFSDRMKQMLEAFSKNYDMVLIDAAPILVGAEVLMLSRMVDKVLFTVRWGHTHRDAVFEALRQLIDAHGDLGGLILSRVDARRYRQYATSPLNYAYTRPVARQFV